MGFTIDGFLEALDLKELGAGRYVAAHVDTGGSVVFGGQILAQSIAAACAGQRGKAVKTLHTVFARAGSRAEPLELTVEQLHSGRALASSTVTVSQGTRLCARSMVLMSADEPDLIRHADRPAGLGSPADAVSQGGQDHGGWEVRIADGIDVNDPEATGPANLDVWTRFAGAPDDVITAQALLAYATDGYLIGTAIRPHEGIGQAMAHKTISTGVLSHTITFHEPFSASDWLLLSHHSPYAGHGRSFGRADVFRQDGQLVASFVQDNMIRAMQKSSSAL
jgi:acyl-CoA thioesterase